MAFFLVLTLLVFMAAGSGRGRGRGRRGASKWTRTTDEASESDPDYQASLPEAMEEAATRAAKGKCIAGESLRGDGSRACEGRSEQATDVPLERRRMFMSKSCIAERYVNFNDLIHGVPNFG